MKRLILGVVMACSTSAVALGAQGPGGRRPGPGPGMGPGVTGGGPGNSAVSNPAEFLLSQTGELKLTDSQVSRLAAIARRSAARRQSLRAQMDSMRPEQLRGERPDSATRERMRQRAEQMRPQMERIREQSQADRRDAIAVLTPDQQAQAWERIATRSARGSGPGAGFRDGRRGPDRMRMQGGGPRGRPNDDAGAPSERRRPRPDVQDSL